MWFKSGTKHDNVKYKWGGSGEARTETAETGILIPLA
jgi:hypothetical protein